MSSFRPYSIYDARLPKLRTGFFMEIAGKFYQVMEVRNNRQVVTPGETEDPPNNTQAYTTDPGLVLNATTNAMYEALHGNITVGRVTQIQYVSLTQATPTVLLKWGTEPLLSSIRNLYIGSNHAPLTNPLQVDKWSYDREMRISLLKATGVQLIWLEIIEYIAVLWKKEPPKTYLKILANGHAVFIQAG